MNSIVAAKSLQKHASTTFITFAVCFCTPLNKRMYEFRQVRKLQKSWRRRSDNPFTCNIIFGHIVRFLPHVFWRKTRKCIVECEVLMKTKKCVVESEVIRELLTTIAVLDPRRLATFRNANSYLARWLNCEYFMQWAPIDSRTAVAHTVWFRSV